jgi:hypothetical protein
MALLVISVDAAIQSLSDQSRSGDKMRTVVQVENDPDPTVLSLLPGNSFKYYNAAF